MLLTAITLVLLAGGVFFFTVGTIGLLRLPDVYTRMHATAKCDTLGLGLILAGLAIYSGISLNSAKLLMIAAVVWLTNPTATHVIAKAVYDSEPRRQQKGVSGGHD